jgi:hypothetical protein
MMSLKIALSMLLLALLVATPALAAEQRHVTTQTFHVPGYRITIIRTTITRSATNHRAPSTTPLSPRWRGERVWSIADPSHVALPVPLSP